MHPGGCGFAAPLVPAVGLGNRPVDKGLNIDESAMFRDVGENLMAPLKLCAGLSFKQAWLLEAAMPNVSKG